MAWTRGICSGHVHPLVLLRNLGLLLKTGFIPEKGSVMTNCSLLVTTVFQWLCIGCQLVHERSGSLCSEPAASWERTACWMSSWYPTCGLVGSDWVGSDCTKPETVLQAGSSGTHMDQGARREEGGTVGALKLGLKNARNCSGSKIRIKWPTQNEAPLGAGAVGPFEVGPLQKTPLLSMGTSFTAFSLVQCDRMRSGVPVPWECVKYLGPRPGKLGAGCATLMVKGCTVPSAEAIQQGAELDAAGFSSQWQSHSS